MLRDLANTAESTLIYFFRYNIEYIDGRYLLY